MDHTLHDTNNRNITACIMDSIADTNLIFSLLVIVDDPVLLFGSHFSYMCPYNNLNFLPS